MRSFILVLITLYRNGISPYFRPRCRFVPSCSAYMEDSVRQYGVFKGLKMGVKRLLRCHPWGSSGWDPVK